MRLFWLKLMWLRCCRVHVVRHEKIFCTYLLLSDLFWDFWNLVVAKVHFGELIGFPPILDELELLKVDDFRGKSCQLTALQAQHTILLGSLESSL